MAKKPPRMIQIRDSVHGYIPVEDKFLDIVDTPAFQRLRSIEQGSFRPVFPGARHDRFIHSLGTYHLAIRFGDHFFKNLRADVPGVRLSRDKEQELKVTFQYAALLHDLGHAPFSHTTEGLFKEQPGEDEKPLIWDLLCDEIKKVATQEDYERFRDSTDEARGAPHEIMSAILLLRNFDRFTSGEKWEGVAIDPELAARMVIGYTYTIPADATKTQTQLLGIKNCMIQLLNSSIMDVDRMDYLGRDTQMSGFVNAPVDLECLGRSVTAVVGDQGHLEPAFREEAINVIDTMFHAKLSHDAWVLAHPAGGYDAALREHCIRRIDEMARTAKKDSYLETVFSVAALEEEGVIWDDKRYRLLSDADILCDMKAYDEAPFNELLTRFPGERRVAAWRSYYEFNYLFDDPKSGLTPEMVHGFFAPLIKRMKALRLFEFNAVNSQTVLDSLYGKADAKPEEEEKIRTATEFLRDYLRDVERQENRDPQGYSVVLLSMTNRFTMKLDPKKIRIRFVHSKLPKRTDGRIYSTYDRLQHITEDDYRFRDYFYLYRYHGLDAAQLNTLRKKLIARIKPGKKAKT